MNRLTALLMAATFVALASRAHADSAAAAFDPLVRVHLSRYYDGATSLAVSDTGALSAVKGNAAVEVSPGTVLTIEGLPQGASSSNCGQVFTGALCSLAPGQSVTLSPSDIAGEQVFFIARGASPAHRYRGSITVIDTPSGTLRVVESVLMEDYLKGVVGPEIGMSAPLEALKAQAIAARTYAVKNFGKCACDGGDADLDDTSRCQSYLGYDAENRRCRAAVTQTAGKIATYDGSPINAVYATDCGGVTAEGDAPYLKSVVDNDGSDDAPWTVTIDFNALAVALQEANVRNVGAISDIEISRKDDSGRVSELTVTSADGSIAHLSGERLRVAIGFNKLRSTLFTLKVDHKTHSCLFTGRGWGHGLGMCQKGAITMAQSNGATYEDILKHYYTGIDISDLTSDFLQDDDDDGRDVADQGLIASSHKTPAHASTAFAHLRGFRAAEVNPLRPSARRGF